MQMAFERPKSRVNVKLLSFMKKTLPEREYRCLCLQSCEPCMVETEEDNKVQKHVFFTSNRLYVVDNGLKTEPKVLCALEDIFQVRKTDSLPSFLSRKDAEETTHVQVTYQSQVSESRTTSSVMARSPALLKKLFVPDKKLAALSTESLNSSGDLEELCEGKEGIIGGIPLLTPSVPKVEQAGFEQPPSQERRAGAGSFEGSSIRDMSMRSTATLVGEDSSQRMISDVKDSPYTMRPPTSAATSDPYQFPDKSPLQSSPGPTIARREKQKTSPLCLHSVASLQAALNRDDPSVAVHKPSVAMHEPSVATQGTFVATHRTSVAVQGPSVTVQRDSSPHGHCQYKMPMPSRGRSLNSYVAEGTWKSSSSLPLTILRDSSAPRRSHSMDFDKTARRDVQSPGVLRKGPRSMLSFESLPSQASSTTEGCPVGLKKATAEFYILNRRSHFHQHLVLAWERRLLSLTWLMGDDAAQPSLETPSQEKLRANYQKLQYEVLCCTECLEETAKLLQELATGCQKYEEIRQFFWEDRTVLAVCLRLLQEHLPPTIAMETKGQRLVHRADQLELSILAMNLLYHMSRGNACAAERMKQLASERGQAMLSLQSAVMSPLTDTLEKRPTSGSEKDEIQKLCCEATDMSACVLSELALASQQQWWRAEDPHRPTPTWFAEAIALHTNCLEYFTRLVTRCSCLLRSKQLAPEEVVPVHHIIHILLFSCSNNVTMLQMCRESFKEEFRYYFRLSLCQNIIADHVPLKQRTLQLLKELKSILREQS